ncbi:MAG TPA: hypothetical protein VN625_06225, partial [Desulfuromonadaceae bacterium]|nr:hypothetical protein [Desulfuromonadaceae bacterium]
MKTRSYTCYNAAGAIIVALGLLFASWTAQAGSIGINFQDNADTGGQPVTSTAFNIDATNWFNLAAGGSGSQVLNTANGGSLTVAWNAFGTWDSTYSDGVAGDGQVYHGWVEFDPVWNSPELPGQYYVTISGLHSAFSNGCVVQTISADNGASSFQPATITNGLQTLNYYAWLPFSDDQLGGVSTVSSTITDDT